MQEFVTDEWQELASAAGLADFETIWQLDIGWFEALNKRGDGWSGVSRMEIAHPDGSSTGIFIKRQQNFIARSWRHPLRGITTVRRELDNLRRLDEIGVPTLDVLYFGERTRDGERQAILISRELTGFISLQEYQARWQRQGYPAKAGRLELIQRIARIARRMHRHRIQQSCFFPKHVFIRGLEGNSDIRLIDLEKAKRSITVRHATLRDLDTFNRHSPGAKKTDRLRFLLAYCGAQRVDRRVRRLWKQLAALAEKKARNRTRSSTPH